MKTKLNSFVLAAIPLAASLVLSACGGSNGSGTGEAPKEVSVTEISASQGEDLPIGVSAAAMKPGYGQPKSQAEIQGMAKRLGAYFNGRNARDPEALVGPAKAQGLPKAAPLPRMVYRFFNRLTGVHFYTISAQERDFVADNLSQFNLEGAAFFAQQATSADLSPVYRFYNRFSGTHFYTISESEKDDVVARLSDIFELEGVAWYASTSAGDGWTPIHRFYNTQTGRHFYTASDEERASVAANLKQYLYEGIGYYIRDTGEPVLSGTVAVDGLVRNAVVCLDLDNSAVCDPGEPASSRTGANGLYVLSFSRGDVSEAAQLAASLITTMVPGDPSSINTTLDQSDGLPVTHSAYVLRQVPGKAGQINPLSTLVATGVVGGMSDADARRNAALQLAFPEAKIDNYQDDPAVNAAAPMDNARLMAHVVARALEEAAPIQLADQTQAVAAQLNDLRSLRYTDASNFSYLEFSIIEKAEGVAGISVIDGRQGRNGGALISEDDLYNQAYLAQNGWTRCRPGITLTSTLGAPSRSTFCNALQTVSYRRNVDVAGRTMSSVVNELQSDSRNTINVGLPTTGLVAALGNATFPGGSELRPRYVLNLNQPVFLNSINTDGRLEGVNATLEVLMADHPVALADAALPNAQASLNLGLGSGNFKNRRVSFVGATSATAGVVQFYECDLDATLTVASNCVKSQTGTYTITTINGDRVMSFAGHAPSVMSHERLYVEVSEANHANSLIAGNWVFMARRLKPGFTHNEDTSMRLNNTGWGAMKVQLGL